MKILTKLILLIAIGLISINAHAVSIDGTWKSDAESTIAFNQANAKLTVKQNRFFSELLGKLTITFKDGIEYSSMPSTMVTVKGEKQNFEGFNRQDKYKIIAQDQNTVVLEIIDDKGKKEISLLKFENEDKFWIYLPISSSIWSQLHIREYFVRQK
jgi:hypothetical protein